MEAVAPQTIRSAPLAGDLPDAARARTNLERLRPDLQAAFAAALHGARAAVLARLLGALDRERLPGIAPRHRNRPAQSGNRPTGHRSAQPAGSNRPTGRRSDRPAGTNRIHLADGRELHYPASAALPFA